MFKAAFALAGHEPSYSVEKLLFKVVRRNQPLLFHQRAQQASLLGSVPACDQMHGVQAWILLQGLEQRDQQLGIGVVLGGEAAGVLDLLGQMRVMEQRAQCAQVRWFDAPGGARGTWRRRTTRTA